MAPDGRNRRSPATGSASHHTSMPFLIITQAARGALAARQKILAFFSPYANPRSLPQRGGKSTGKRHDRADPDRIGAAAISKRDSEHRR